MLRPGTVVDRYVVEGFLGEGGAAAVYRVRHRALGTVLALKVLRVPSPATVGRLLREGRLMGAIEHENLLAIRDQVEVDGVPALVVEYANGPSLAQVLADGPVPASEATRIGLHLLRGLAVAHAAGMVHRDVKPGNVLLDVGDRGYRAKLSDFGLAKLLADASPAHVTRTGATLGTPAYMAIEQFGGAASADPRADVFSAAVVLYEMFTGRLPYPDESPVARLRRSLDDGAHVAAGVLAVLPAELRDVLERALASDPAARFPDAGALLAAWAPTEPDPPTQGFLALLESRTPRIEPTESDSVTPSWNATLPTTLADPPPAPPAAPQPLPSPTPRPRSRATLVGSLALLLGAGLGAAGLLRSRGPAAPTLRELGPTEGVVLSLAVGGDVRAWTDGADVWMVVGEGPPQNLTAGVTPAVLDVSLSGDGSLAAWSEDGRVVLYRPRTGERSDGPVGAHHPAVSRDGTLVAWITRSIPDPLERASLDSHLGVYDVRTRTNRILLSDVDVTAPTFSPDGSRIAFAGGRIGLATVGVNGRELRSLEAIGYAPLWDRPDRILSAEVVGDGARVVSTPVDPEGAATGPRVEVASVPGGRVDRLTLDGDRVLVTTVAQHAGLLRIDLDDQRHEVGRRWIAPPDAALTAPDVDAAGRVVAATFHPDERLVLVEPEGLRTLLDGWVSARGPRWLPDGDLVFYGVGAGRGTLQVHRLRMGEPGTPVESPGMDTASRTYMAAPSADGAVVSTVTEEGTRLLRLRWDQPWDEQIAAQKGTAPTGWLPVDERADGALLVTDLRGLAVWRSGTFTPLRQGTAWGAWSDDGERVWFSTADAVGWIEPRTGREELVAHVDGRIPLGEALAVGPADRFLVVGPRTSSTAQWELR